MSGIILHTVDDRGTILTGDRSVMDGCVELGMELPGYMRMQTTIPREDMIRMARWLLREAKND